MVDHLPTTSAALDRTFAALGDPTRRAILSRLREGTATVGEIARPFPMSLNAVSKHVQVLERAGLIRREVCGREHRLFLSAGPLREANDWTGYYRRFWHERIDALDRLVSERRDHTRPIKERKP